MSAGSADTPEDTAMTYDQWTEELVKLAIEHYGFEAPANYLRDPAWKDFFDEGYSPEDALQEELSNA